MNIIKRSLTNSIHTYRKKFPVLTLTGVRQSGKTTLLRDCLPAATCVSLEDPDLRAIAAEDPRGFLRQYHASFETPLIIDEAQRVPELFSYLQTIVDDSRQMGAFLLSGSHNFLLMEGISQSLAGRTAVFRLFPLSVGELRAASLLPDDLYTWLFTGGYPALYDRQLLPGEYFPSYVQTYIERDVRLLRNVSDAGTFLRFVRLCAARSGQILNYADLASACGITVPTVRAWLSVLETGHLITLLPPYYRNFEKRIIKSPKLYFLDSGLLCYLLGITSADALKESPALGAIFESMVIAEYHKSRFFEGKEPNAYFYRDTNGNEIDLITEDDGRLLFYEIKSGATMQKKYFDTMQKIGKKAGVKSPDMICIYGGDASLRSANGYYLSWRDIKHE